MDKYNMSGVTSLNDYKNHDKQPDLTGKCTIDGKEYRMAGWKRTGINGDFISWKFSVPETGKHEPQKIDSSYDTKDSLPF